MKLYFWLHFQSIFSGHFRFGQRCGTDILGYWYQSLMRWPSVVRKSHKEVECIVLSSTLEKTTVDEMKMKIVCLMNNIHSFYIQSEGPFQTKGQLISKLKENEK